MRTTYKLLNNYLLVAIILAFVTPKWSWGQNVSATWGANANTAWYTTGNWVGSAYAGSQGTASSNSNVATFTSAFTGTAPGINLNTNSLNLGGISIDNTRTTATNIGNSSGTANTNQLRLYGTTINSIANTILRNNGSGLLTLNNGNAGMTIILGNSTENIITIDGTGGITIAAPIADLSGNRNLTKTGLGSGVLTLSASNTFTGNTTISAGTLALSGAGSISSSPQIIIASGATFDVTGLTTALSLGASQSLRSSATGSNTTATVTVSSTKGMTLSAGGLMFTAFGGGTTAPLTVAGASAGAIALNSAPVTVTTTTALSAGTYVLVNKSGSATGVTGTSGTLTINGSGLASGCTGSLSVFSGQLILNVITTPGAPTITSITPGNNQLAVNFTAPSSDGGSAITNYKYSTDGGSTFTACSPAQTTSPITIIGLTNGTSYNIQIKAVNAIGDGTATASTAATPSASGAPNLAITGTTAFGSVCTNSNGQQIFTITNNGTAQADGVAVSSTDPQFVVSGLSTTTIAASGTATYTVTFTPSSAGNKTATINVTSTTSGSNAPTSSLTGTGLAPVTAAVTTSAATLVTNTTATLNGNVTTLGVCPASTEKGFVHAATSTNNAPQVGGTGVTKIAVGSIATGAYTQALTGLTSGTQYSVNSYVYNGSTYTYGTVNTFTTSITAPSAVTATTKTPTSFTISFTNGSGSNRLIVARISATAATAPVNGTTYTVNSNSFSDALNATTATGNIVVYSGSGSSATITGLNSETAYSFDVYEFNGSGSTTIYSTAATLATQRTLSAAPTVQATLSTSIASYNQIDITIASTAFPASGATKAGYIVIYGTGAVTLSSANGVAPSSGSGTIFSTTATSLPTLPATTINVTGLNPATAYNFLVVPYTWDGTNASTYNYLTASAPTASATTNNGPTVDINAATPPYAFGTIVGTYATGSANYPIAGTNLVADVVVTAPTNFEVSKDDVTFSSSVTYTQVAGSLPVNSFVYVRFNPSTINGTNSGNISHTSTGAATQSVAVSAKVIATEPTTPATSVSFTNVTGTTFTINWTNGNGGNRIVLVKSGSAVNATPTDETTYTANTTFISGTQIGTGNYVVYAGTGTSVNVTGLTLNTTYHVAVFEYNKGTVNTTENYFTTSAIGNQTCINPTYYSQASGDPATLSNWNTNRLGGGSTPSNLTTIGTYVIQNGHNLTTTGALSFGATGAKLQIENGGTLTANHAITIAAGATFQIDNGGTYKQNSAIAMTSTIFNGTEVFGASSNFEITVNPSGTTSPSSPGFGNLTINVTSGASAFGWSANITQVQGNLIILGTGTGSTRHALTSGTNQTLSIGGDFTITSGNLWLSSGAGTVTVTVGGNLIVNGGTLDIANSSGVGVINVGGDLSLTSGTLTEGGSTTTSKIVFNKTGTQNYTSGASISNVVNFEIASNSIVNLGTNVISGAGTVTVNNGGTIKAGSTSASGALAGNVTASGGVVLNTGSTVEYNGTAAQTLATRTFHHLVISNTNGVTQSGAITVNGSLTVGNTAILDAAAQVISFGAGATATINGTLKTSNTNGLMGSATTTFNNTNSPTITLGASSTVEYNAGSAQTISPSIDYINVVINGNSTKTIGSATTINGTLTLTAGVLDAANILTIPTTGSIIHNGGSIINYTLPNTLNNYTPPTGATLSSNLTVTGTLNVGSTILDIGATTLTINGDVSRTTGTIKTNGGTIVLGGTTSSSLYFDQTTPGTTNKIKDMTLNRTGATVTIGNALQIADNGTVTVTAGTLASGGNLTLTSTLTGTARIAELGAGANITGNVEVQRYMVGGATSQRGWRCMSTPVSGATYAQLVDDIFITGPGGTASGFDANGSNSSVMYYEESATRGWKSITNPTNTWDAGKGALVFFRGDRTQTSSLTNTNVAPNSFALDYSGTINSGDVTVALDFNSAGLVADQGWNLIGNPYPSQIDWASVNRSVNTDSYYYILNPNTKNYVSQNTGTLAIGQAFFVLVDAATSITFQENDKTASTGTAYFKTAVNPLTIKMKLDNVQYDVATLNFENNSSKNYVFKEDAIKLKNSVYNLAFVTPNNREVQYNVVNYIGTTGTDTFDLNVTSTTNTSYTLNFTNFDEVPLTKAILLVDKLNNNLVNLRITPDYTFTINNSTSTTFGNRFALVITDQYTPLPVKLTSFAGKKLANANQLSWTTASEKNMVAFEIERSNDGKNFEPIGLVKPTNTNTNNNYTFNDITAQGKVNYYRLKMVDAKNSEYSNVVSIANNEVVEVIEVYPNPAENVLSVRVPQNAIIHNIKVIDLNGTVVIETSNNTQLDVSTLAKGVYLINVQIDDEMKTLKFVKK